MNLPRGLSLLQAPPFIVVSGFFITACFLWFLGSLVELVAFFTDRLSLPLFVHITTLGFALFTMFGALFQMLPVVAGAVIDKPKEKALLSWILMLLGYIPFILGFYLKDLYLLLFGALLLLVAILYTSLLMLSKLLKIKSYTPTSKGMKFALFFLLLGAFFGFLVVLSYAGYIPHTGYLLRTHMLLMLFGWVFSLVASVSFQVVEMFFVTKPYPPFYAFNFPYLLIPTLFIGLLEFKISRLPLTVLVMFHALLTLHRLFTRRRKVAEKSLYFWYVSHANLLLAMLLFIFYGFEVPFLIAFGLFFSTLIMGMMFRIIPFLVWFHLSSEGSSHIPLMSEVIDQRLIKSCLVLSILLSLSLYSLPITKLELLPILIHLFLSLLLFYSILKGSLLYFGLSPLYNASK